MIRTKGINLDNLRAYVIDCHGPAAYTKVLEHLAPADRDSIEHLITLAWYDFDLEPRLLATIDSVLGNDDKALVKEAARYAVDRDSRGIQRLFMRIANPGYLLARSGDYWSRFYDAGRWQVVRHSRCTATGTLCGFDVKSDIFCEFLGTYIHRLFELGGAQNAALDHPRCRARGAVECVFRGSWA